LVRKYQKLVLHVAFRVTGNRMDAEDVRQNSFLKAFEKLHLFEGRSTFGTWVARIAIREAIDHMRRDVGIHCGAYRDEADADLALLPDVHWHTNPERGVLDVELQERLCAAVASLPRALRSVFVLRVLEDRSIHETARILQVSETVIKVRLHRARRQLRDSMRDLIFPAAHDGTHIRNSRARACLSSNVVAGRAEGRP
jgi:RNA polymerase sigma-70 factor (ECF subfamily)